MDCKNMQPKDAMKEKMFLHVVIFIHTVYSHHFRTTAQIELHY